jgi:bifunctional non-homologous end joining protein LigD
LPGLPADFVIDGEVCYAESDQKADFQKLQRDDGDQEHLHYYAFDILWLNGHNLQAVPLMERKKILQLLLTEPPPHIHTSNMSKTMASPSLQRSGKSGAKA